MVFCSIIVCACQTLPESSSSAARALKKSNFPQDSIQNLVSGKKISEPYLGSFANSTSDDVRFLVASNSYINQSLMEKFEYDSSMYVRSGLASNPNISKALMRRLVKQKSWDINSNLAKNPSVCENLLLDIYRNSSPYQRSILLLSYSKNPKIPQEIRSAIESSNNEPAKDNLRRMNRSQ
jgi:hypothetical protein